MNLYSLFRWETWCRGCVTWKRQCVVRNRLEVCLVPRLSFPNTTSTKQRLTLEKTRLPRWLRQGGNLSSNLIMPVLRYVLTGCSIVWWVEHKRDLRVVCFSVCGSPTRWLGNVDTHCSTIYYCQNKPNLREQDMIMGVPSLEVCLRSVGCFIASCNMTAHKTTILYMIISACCQLNTSVSLL